jgi:hypothetical protein
MISLLLSRVHALVAHHSKQLSVGGFTERALLDAPRLQALLASAVKLLLAMVEQDGGQMPPAYRSIVQHVIDKDRWRALCVLIDCSAALAVTRVRMTKH